jgi:hypothetical protein
MNPAFRTATAVAAFAVCLAVLVSCAGDRAQEGAGSEEVSTPPLAADETTTPDVQPPSPPSARFDVRCERVLTEALRERHMYGWPVEESAGPDHATCTFDDGPFKRIIVSFDCRPRAITEERVAQVRNALEAAGMRQASSPGRLAFVSREGVPTLFWDDDTDCEVSTDRVGWNEPDAAGTARAHAVAEALTPASIAR